MEKNLKKIIKKAKGSLLGIGIENEKLIDAINDNNDINVCYLLESKGKKGGKLSFRGRHKKVNIKKLKKYFTKKRTNTIICNYKYIQKFMRHFVPGSVYINNGKLYIYGKMNTDEINEIKDKYSRYTKDILIEQVNNEYLITIDNENTKNNFFKDKLYSIKDLFESILDFITNILIN